MYVNCISNPKYYILFSHGNAVDLGREKFSSNFNEFFLLFLRSNG
jgi:hypothetical protein